MLLEAQRRVRHRQRHPHLATSTSSSGDATQALLLSPKGKIEFAFRVAVLEDGVLLDTEAATAPALAERLARFVFRYDVTVGRPGPGAAASLPASGPRPS